MVEFLSLLCTFHLIYSVDKAYTHHPQRQQIKLICVEFWSQSQRCKRKRKGLHGRGIWLAPGPLKVNASFFLYEFKTYSFANISCNCSHVTFKRSIKDIKCQVMKIVIFFFVIFSHFMTSCAIQR